MRKRLFIIVLGVAFLILMASLGTLIDTITPRRGSSAPQIISQGNYTFTLTVDPTPPLTTAPTTFSLQITNRETGTIISRAPVTLQASMERQNLQLTPAPMPESSPGTYTTHLTLTASGAWQITVTLAATANQPAANVTFEVTAQ